MDWKGVGARLYPVDRLRAIKTEHEAWIAFIRSRPPADAEGLAGGAPELGVQPGVALRAGGQVFRLPATLTCEQEWSAGRDAVRTASRAYAEQGDAGDVWVRRVAARAGSAAGLRWRRELADEAALLGGILPGLPGLPQLVAVEVSPAEVILVTALPAGSAGMARSGAAAPRGLATLRDRFQPESARALLAGLPTLCAALGALHDAGRAHGALHTALAESLDRGPILVDKRGNLVLRDLGTATADQPAAKGRDVISLARIVYELLTGVPPLEGEDGSPVLASAHNPSVPEPAARTMNRIMAGQVRDVRALGSPRR